MSERLDTDTVVDGRYRIERRLGSGGMADVYLATDEQLGRRIALKVLYRRFSEDPEFVERFRREASAAAGLQHQHVVSVYDRGEWEGTYYIAMEYLDGRPLKSVIAQEAPLDPDIAVAYAIQILKAARFAHRRGVIHRDLKPHNVIVDDEGVLTVTDFGIARAGASDMTQTGSIMGTAQYLSPEQAQGHAVSVQSDLYSVGIVLYEMLTGRVPFDGDSAVAIALKQVGEAPVPPAALHPQITPELEQVVLRALAKEPAARFADADEFIAALEAAQAGIASAGPPTDATILAAPGAAWAADAVAAPPPPAYGHPPPPDEGDDEGPGRRWWLFVVAALAAVGILLAALLLLRTDEVTVPNVVGSELATAQSTLQAEGFSVESVTRVSERPKGEVIGQNPEQGTTADKGSLVTLTVSDGPGLATIPGVAGQTEAQARRLLEQAGFRVRVRERSSDSVRKGEAIETQPGENSQAERGSTVNLIVSAGARQVAVPDVVGATEASARGTLTGAGFTVTATEREDERATPGTVLSQSPAAGSQADKGSAVTIVVARQPEEVSVPNVVGEDQASAIETLTDAGFRVGQEQVEVTDETDDGTVVQQDPSGGRAQPGSTVTIGVGNFRPPPETTTTTPVDPGGAAPEGTP
jgi:serine/threonine-protein kinase